jgi:hypothetical protein
VNGRPSPVVPSVNGVTVSWRMKSYGAASLRRSRHAMRGGCSKEADLKPHLIRYWLTLATDESAEKRDDKIADVCSLYREAPTRVAVGVRHPEVDSDARGVPDQPVAQGCFPLHTQTRVLVDPIERLSSRCGSSDLADAKCCPAHRDRLRVSRFLGSGVGSSSLPQADRAPLPSCRFR